MNNIKNRSLYRTIFYIPTVIIICILGANGIINAQQNQSVGEEAFSESVGSNNTVQSPTESGDQPRIVLMDHMVYLPLVIKPDVLSETEQAVLDIVNAERANAGCGPLVANPTLTTAARNHSQDMADNNFTSHEGSNGSTPGERVTDLGYGYSSLGENIAWGYSSANNVMNGWMNSSGHRANILNCNYTEIGIGHVFDTSSTYWHYWTQVFARPN